MKQTNNIAQQYQAMKRGDQQQSSPEVGPGFGLSASYRGALEAYGTLLDDASVTFLPNANRQLR
jgi:hypothetical protein